MRGCLKTLAIMSMFMIVLLVACQVDTVTNSLSAIRVTTIRESARATKTPVKPTQPQYTVKRISPPLTRQTRDVVNLRRGPGTEYEKVGTLPGRTKLSIVGESGDWYQISHNGRRVFIANWLTFELPTATPILRSTAPPRIRVRKFSSPQRKYTHGELNLRSGPGTSYRRVAAVGAGATLQILGQSGDWYLIKTNGRDAYVASWLVHNSPPVARRQQPAQQQPAQSSAAAVIFLQLQKDMWLDDLSRGLFPIE